ncbi:acetate--CoA ligase family protein [Natranaerofaba carboxydovora]|uniref:acetate--CoA ligase family protein n=1 Tax=Natranaerofaba carboxydovora TaxID=2742683 RepID=UPI001F134C5A|nr:acetate--CoA ligase family protein [Natranaerofaba carboxydovora]UMZ73775.1 ATP-grasp domain protein [Natranaerofaba carboxydovora]
MEKFFYPKSIVIIGLSSKSSNIPRLTLENLLRWGYRGRIFGVNPRVDDKHVNGVKMYKRLEDLPEVPDLAYCMVSAKFVPSIVEHCGNFGIKRMAIPSGGFSEFGEEGESLANKTVEIAKKYGIRFVGPNGVTVANTKSGLCLPFVSLHKPPEGKMSIVSQSGAVALTMLNYLEDEKIGLAKFASIGNKLDLDEVDFVEYLGDDPNTEIICLYLESVDRGRDFINVVKDIDKPIIVYKSNTTSAGEKAAMSHTAAVSNNEDIINSAFEEAGVIRIDNFLDFVEVTKAFHLPPMKGRRIMAMSPAGGFTVSAADMCEEIGFEFADMGDDFYEQLKKYSSANIINFSNPLDMGNIYDTDTITNVFHTVMHSDQVDGAIYVTQRPDMPEGESVFHDMFLTDFSKEIKGNMLSSNKPFGLCLFGPDKMISKAKNISDFPIFNSPDGMINALKKQQKFYEQKEKLLEDTKNELEFPPGIDHNAAQNWMDGKKGDLGEEVLELLSSYDIPVAESKIAKSKNEAIDYARELGFPVAMKLVSPDVLHKSDAGGVMLNINRPEEVEKSFDTIRENLIKYDKSAGFSGVRIQQMATEGYEMFVGGRQDPSFGPVVSFGMGGIYIEVFRDVASLLCPAKEESIRKHLERLNAYEILEGARGKTPGDIYSFVDMIKRVSILLYKFPNIIELDLNPVMVRENSILTIDARVRIE